MHDSYMDSPCKHVLNDSNEFLVPKWSEGRFIPASRCAQLSSWALSVEGKYHWGRKLKSIRTEGYAGCEICQLKEVRWSMIWSSNKKHWFIMFCQRRTRIETFWIQINISLRKWMKIRDHFSLVKTMQLLLSSFRTGHPKIKSASHQSYSY